MRNYSLSFFKPLLVATILAFLSACGGSGAGSDPQTIIDPPQPPLSATVTVLLTDAPSDEFDEINVTISSISLLGGDAPVVLFEGLETIDLLMLENFADLFSISEDVPAGTYEKVRLQIEDLQLVRKDDDGNIIETVYPDLPANGKLDLNPRGSIELEPGDDVVLQLDIDARRSIQIVGTGNGGYRFRPVVFVDLLDDDFDGKAVRINGEIVAIDEGAGTFDICQDSPSSSDDDYDDDDGDSDSDSDGDSDDDSGSDSDSDSDDDNGSDSECLTVSTDDQTGFFDNNADSAGFSSLMIGDTVLVIGGFENNEGSTFAATVVAIDTDGMFSRYEGTVQSAVDANNTFDLLLDSGQGFVSDTVIGVLVQPGTGISDDDGNLLDTSYIEPDLEAEIDGLLMLSNVDPDVIKAIYVSLDLDSDDDVSDDDRISGQILSVDESAGSLLVATDEGDRCVSLDDDADIFLITIVEDASTTEAIDLSDVTVDSTADIYGDESVDGCFVAETILITG